MSLEFPRKNRANFDAFALTTGRNLLARRPVTEGGQAGPGAAADGGRDAGFREFAVAQRGRRR